MKTKPVMKTKIVAIGNSRGIRIPKHLLERSRLSGEVDLVAREGTLVVRAVKHPRAAWGDAFRVMATRHDDRLIEEPCPSSAWDRSEWTW
ncbi:MAG: AbrB/MazE/SpoVT family DNA-binding domain-containing protein [Solirubrobacterales bacterium]